MTDDEALQLLRLLHKYLETFNESSSIPVVELADDLAMGMDETTDEADRLRREINQYS